MANRPVNTGSGGAAMPPPVHHDAIPPAPLVPSPPAPATASSAPGVAPASHRATRRRPSRVPTGRGPRDRGPGDRVLRNRGPRDHGSHASWAADDEATAAGGLAWLPYLVVLAGVAGGMFVVWLGSKYAGPGTALVGCSLLAGAVFRLVLPARDAGLLSSRRKASDVLAFAAFGAAVLAVAIALP
jgi:DUF3017 family protein